MERRSEALAFFSKWCRTAFLWISFKNKYLGYPQKGQTQLGVSFFNACSVHFKSGTSNKPHPMARIHRCSGATSRVAHTSRQSGVRMNMFLVFLTGSIWLGSACSLPTTKNRATATKPPSFRDVPLPPFRAEKKKHPPPKKKRRRRKTRNTGTKKHKQHVFAASLVLPRSPWLALAHMAVLFLDVDGVLATSKQLLDLDPTSHVRPKQPVFLFIFSPPFFPFFLTIFFCITGKKLCV